MSPLDAERPAAEFFILQQVLYLKCDLKDVEAQLKPVYSDSLDEEESGQWKELAFSGRTLVGAEIQTSGFRMLER